LFFLSAFPGVRSIFDVTDDGEGALAAAEDQEEPASAAEASISSSSPLLSVAERDHDEAAAVLVSLGTAGHFAVSDGPAETPVATRRPGPAETTDTPLREDVFYTPASVRSIPGAEFVTARPDFAEDARRNDDDSVVLAEMAPVKLAFDGDENVQERH
jgi:hypothetical protein